MFRKWYYKRRIKNELKNCNYKDVSDAIEKNLSGKTYIQPLATLLNNLKQNPSFDTAYELIIAYPKFLNYFWLGNEDSKSTHTQIMTLDMTKDWYKEFKTWLEEEMVEHN